MLFEVFSSIEIKLTKLFLIFNLEYTYFRHSNQLVIYHGSISLKRTTIHGTCSLKILIIQCQWMFSWKHAKRRFKRHHRFLPRWDLLKIDTYNQDGTFFSKTLKVFSLKKRISLIENVHIFTSSRTSSNWTWYFNETYCGYRICSGKMSPSNLRSNRFLFVIFGDIFLAPHLIRS